VFCAKKTRLKKHLEIRTHRLIDSQTNIHTHRHIKIATGVLWQEQSMLLYKRSQLHKFAGYIDNIKT